MHRFFSSDINDDKIIITDASQIHHIKDVLRLRPADEIVVFDDKGNECVCTIKNLMKDKVILQVETKRKIVKTKRVRLTIACSLAKKAKFDDIVDKLTQLGVDKIIPMLTERVIVKIDKDKIPAKLSRWNKIAQSAAQQSQRSDIPIIEPIKSLKEVLSEAQNYDLKLIPHLTGERKILKDIFTQHRPKNILVLIGPEGDFSPKEVALAKDAGCISVSLGDLILRVDTAAIAVASFLRLYERA